MNQMIKYILPNTFYYSWTYSNMNIVFWGNFSNMRAHFILGFFLDMCMSRMSSGDTWEMNQMIKCILPNTFYYSWTYSNINVVFWGNFPNMRAHFILGFFLGMFMSRMCSRDSKEMNHMIKCILPTTFYYSCTYSNINIVFWANFPNMGAHFILGFFLDMFMSRMCSGDTWEMNQRIKCMLANTFYYSWTYSTINIVFWGNFSNMRAHFILGFFLDMFMSRMCSGDTKEMNQMIKYILPNTFYYSWTYSVFRRH